MPTATPASAPAPNSARLNPLLALLFLVASCAAPRAAPPAPPAPGAVSVGYEETGNASWYGPPYHGRRTSSGEVYDMHQMTAAHQYLPLGTWVAVENLRNGRVAEVRINDRGPFAGGRILDLSYAAARIVGAVGPGVIPVRLRVTALPDGSQPARIGTFAVQVASFTSEDRALALKAELSRTWPGTSVRRAEVGGRAVFRVRVGRFATRQEAERLAQDLATAGYAVLLVED